MYIYIYVYIYIYIYIYIYVYYSYNFKAAILIKPMLMHTKEASYSMFIGISNIFMAVLLSVTKVVTVHPYARQLHILSHTDTLSSHSF